MFIVYPIVAQRPPYLLNQAPQNYPILKRSVSQSTERIRENIRKSFGLHLADLPAVVSAMSHEIRQSLESDKAWQFEQLGSFFLGARVKGWPDPGRVRKFILKK